MNHQFAYCIARRLSAECHCTLGWGWETLDCSPWGERRISPRIPWRDKQTRVMIEKKTQSLVKLAIFSVSVYEKKKRINLYCNSHYEWLWNELWWSALCYLTPCESFPVWQRCNRSSLRGAASFKARAAAIAGDADHLVRVHWVPCKCVCLHLCWWPRTPKVDD